MDNILEPKYDNELPMAIANLDIDSTSPIQPNQDMAGRRVLRKRQSLDIVKEQKTNRRVIKKPKNLLNVDGPSQKELEAIYKNTKVKQTSQTLETIFEEPKSDKNETLTLIGGKKLKRLLNFPNNSHYTKEKIKKRRAKIKRLFGNKFINRKKIPMQAFMKVIHSFDNEEDDEHQNGTG